MCTVSFLPVSGGGYLLGTNRDESPRRGRAHAPAAHRLGARVVLMPRDPDAGGTWVAVDDLGRCLCILNGDLPAVPPPSEAPSRGTLLLDMMSVSSSAAILHELQRRHRSGELVQKAFKLLVVDPGARPGEGDSPASAALIEWNGLDEPTSRALQGPCVLVSSSFDPEGVARRRELAFTPLATMSAGDTRALAEAQSRWHATHSAEAPDGDTYTVCMHREEAATVSYTAVRVDARRVRMDYRAGAPCGGAALERISVDRTGDRTGDGNG
jgi:hypothetical protein